MNNRDSFIFYRSFYEAISDLEDKQQLEVYQAIAEYSLNFKEPNLEGISSTILKLIKPQLEANNKRYVNGSKPKRKQNGSKTEAKEKLTTSKPKANKNNNVNVNDNVNNNILLNSSSFDEWLEYKKYKSKAPITKCVNFLIEYPKEIQKQIIDTSIMNNWKGLFPPKNVAPTKDISEVSSPLGKRAKELLDAQNQNKDIIEGEIVE